MSFKTQTEYGESLNLEIHTQVMRVAGTLACFVKVSSKGNLIRRSFGGFSPQQFKWADEQAQTLKILTGATVVPHTYKCDREHPVTHGCNLRDGNLTRAESEMR